MSKYRVRSLMVISACLCLARAAAAADERLGLAASDPRQVPAIVAAMDAKDVPAFAGLAIQAAAKMPTSPKQRLAQMRDVAVAFAKAVPEAELPALLAQLVINTPFKMLPGLVEAFKPPLAAQLKPVADPKYAKLSASVMGHIGRTETLPDDDKTIFTAFAIVLLARGRTLEEEHACATGMLTALPAAYRDQVGAALPAALAGDYTPLLGPGAAQWRLVSPHGKVGERPVNLADVLGEVAKQPDLLVHDVNRPAPLARTEIADRYPAPPASTTTTPKPVIPEPYKAQF